jgi:hypothetical protein
VTTTQNVTGNAPLTFTNSFGAQRSVPLSALQFSGSVIGIASSWSSAFTPADTTILLALAKDRVATGDLAAAPVLPPVPAVSFTAAAPGPQGNNITVNISSVTCATGDVLSALTADLVIDATETDTYSGLASAADAVQAIGVDTAPASPTDPPQGGGLVVVQSGSAAGPGLPKTGPLSVTTGGTNVLAADGNSTLFVLKARSGYSGAGITTTIALDPSGNTFTLTATYDAGNTTAVAETDLAALPAPVAFLVTASAPPGGLAQPATGNTTLSGGAWGLPATGAAYTG